MNSITNSALLATGQVCRARNCVLAMRVVAHARRVVVRAVYVVDSIAHLRSVATYLGRALSRHKPYVASGEISCFGILCHDIRP